VRRFWFQLAAAAVFLLAWITLSALTPKHESGTFAIDPPTPYTHYLPLGTSRGRVLVIHGLDVTREVMSLASEALVDGGFEVYAIDLPGHGDSRAKFDTERAEEAIRNTVAKLGEDTIVLGHSLGAGLLLDLAASQRFSTMVLLAPPPLATSEIQADRVLIATGAIDVPRIRSFVPIAEDIGGAHVEAWILPWAGHSAAIFSPVYIRKVVDWLGGDAHQLKTIWRIVSIVAMFVAGVVFGVRLLNSPPQPRRGGAPALPSSAEEGNGKLTTTLVLYVAACCGALLVLKFFNPMGWLRLFTTDYLVGFIFIAGIILMLPAKKTRPQNLFTALLAAAYVIVVLGFAVSSHIVHMSLSGDRWWRFPCIAAAGLPLFFADEAIIRPLRPRWKSILAALVTRALLLAFLLVGVLILDRENAFLFLIAPLITVFWIGLWFASRAVHRGTQNALATALFAALVQGWAFAAWFVTI
jgi:pimeloyl-ACP methyl ester carboxylesterase